MVKSIILVVCAAGCGSFQDPNIVVDLRVIGMTATVPEQVVDIDLSNPPPAAVILQQLVPSTVCALVADPDHPGRRLRWSMTMCPPADYERCSDDDPEVLIGSGLLDDPLITVPEPQMCATVMPDSDLIAVVESALAGDALHGLQGEQYDVMLRVGGEGADPDQDLYASKALQIAARIPPDRTPNQNPFLDEIDASTSASADGFVLPLGRCVDQASPIVVPPDTTVHIMPVEPPGIHEVYTIPTLDGQLDTFTESITYQWTAGAGSFSTGMTGGARDIFGNMPPIGNDWTSPSAHDLKGETMDVPIWIVQRDERLGAAWFESCLRVAP